jgi:hypothetical protein
MNILLVYHLRLGDIVRCLPIAKWFHNQGHKVYFECGASYHGLFDLIHYAQPVLPAPRGDYDRVIDLQVWPDKFERYVNENRPWAEFVCDLFPEGKKIDMSRIELDRPPIVVDPCVRDSVVVFPRGYSQLTPVSEHVMLGLAHRVADGRPVIALGKAEHGYHECQDIGALCAIIANARQVVTLNSAPTVIAAAYRKSWIHICECERDDFFHFKQVRVQPKR